MAMNIVCMDKRTSTQYRLVNIDLESGTLYYLDDEKLVKSSIRNFIIFEQEKDYRKV